MSALFTYPVSYLSTFLLTEFDNPSFGYSDSPHHYRHAFQALVHACEKHIHHCRNKINFVWHSWGASENVKLEDFYPGDGYVDWVGVSLFQQVYPWADDDDTNVTSGEYSGGNMDDVTAVLQFAQQHSKPIMIAESTPFFGMYLEEQYPAILDKYGLTSNVDIWSLWFEPTLELIQTYDIGMWSYINADWNSQAMWRGTGFGDTRLSRSANVMEYWWNDVLDNPRFTTELKCHHFRPTKPPKPAATKPPKHQEKHKVTHRDKHHETSSKHRDFHHEHHNGHGHPKVLALGSANPMDVANVGNETASLWLPMIYFVMGVGLSFSIYKLCSKYLFSDRKTEYESLSMDDAPVGGGEAKGYGSVEESKEEELEQMIPVPRYRD